MNQNLVRFQLHPRARDPGPGRWKAAPDIPPSKRLGLLATFNGGFKISTSGGGFYLNGATSGVLTKGVASVVYYRDGRISIGNWGGSVRMTPDVVGVRQNLHLILAHGKIPRLGELQRRDQLGRHPRGWLLRLAVRDRHDPGRAGHHCIRPLPERAGTRPAAQASGRSDRDGAGHQSGLDVVHVLPAQSIIRRTKSQSTSHRTRCSRRTATTAWRAATSRLCTRGDGPGPGGGARRPAAPPCSRDPRGRCAGSRPSCRPHGPGSGPRTCWSWRPRWRQPRWAVMTAWDTRWWRPSCSPWPRPPCTSSTTSWTRTGTGCTRSSGPGRWRWAGCPDARDGAGGPGRARRRGRLPVDRRAHAGRAGRRLRGLLPDVHVRAQAHPRGRARLRGRGLRLRALGRVSATRVPPSGWFLVVCSLGALLVAIAKRYTELALLGPDAPSTGRSCAGTPPGCCG